MNRRILAAVVAVSVLGGGSVAFVVWRKGAERTDLVQRTVREVDAELAGAAPEAESLRLLLRSVRDVQSKTPAAEIDIAEARILLALGRTQEAWDVARPYATEPGASDDALRVGAEILAVQNAESGADRDGRQALAFAQEHAQRTGSSASLFLAWQLAFRVGEPGAFLAASKRILESGVEPQADAVRATVADLAGRLADRLGIARDQLRPGADGSAGILAELRGLGADAAPTESSLDRIAEQFPRRPPEVDLVAAARVLDRFGGLTGDATRSAEAESLLRDAVQRLDLVLAELRSSVEARHLAAVALIATWQSFGLDDEQLARCRGHLSWLVQNAPPSHVQRALWQRLAAEFSR